jgi:hypothetical protein
MKGPTNDVNFHLFTTRTLNKTLQLWFFFLQALQADNLAEAFNASYGSNFIE